MNDRLCECGCGQSLEGLRSNARYASDACRSRAWKARAGYVDPRTAKPRRNVSKPRKPSIRISYRKALEQLEDYLISIGHDAPYTQARALLRPLLTPAQREYVT